MAVRSCSPDRDGYLPFRRILPQLVLLSSLFLLNFLSRIIFSPLLPKIEQELGFSHTVAGSFFLWISAGYFFSVLSSGFVSARITFKASGVTSLVSGIAPSGLRSSKPVSCWASSKVTPGVSDLTRIRLLVG